MGLLDQVLSGVLNSRGTGGQNGGHSPLLPILMALLSSRGGQSGGLGGVLGGGGNPGGAGQTAGLNGGLGGLIDMFTQVGQGETAKSWISSGPNRSIAPQDVEKVTVRSNRSAAV